MLLLCHAALCLSCHAKLVPQHAVLNQEIKDEKGYPVLLGKCTKERLQQPPFDSWFTKNYNDYHVDSATADQLKSALTGKRLMIFMGTWCGDSRREVPRIFRILDYCGVPSSSIELIMVNDADSVYKQSPGHEEKGRDIFRVPDLLVFQDHKELGRIVESPVISLEKDLLALLKGGDYSPNYKGAALLIHAFRETGMTEMGKDLPPLAARVKPLVASPGELNSYAHVLRAAGEKEEAGIVLAINALIFPK